jgi:hypothetical protein
MLMFVRLFYVYDMIASFMTVGEGVGRHLFTDLYVKMIALRAAAPVGSNLGDMRRQ